MECYNIKGINFYYGKNRVLNNISISLQPGRFYGVIGPNGCGKTTLIDLLIRNRAPLSGNISLFGSPLKQYTRKQLARSVALVPQNFYINFAFTVEEIVLMGRHPYIPKFSTPSSRDLAMVYRAIAETDIEDMKSKYINALSGGERQRIIFARALAQDAPILLLDEATSNLDIKHTLEILDIVARQVKTKQKTVIAVFHDLNLAAHYCDYLLFMKKGALVVHGSIDDVFTEHTISSVFEVDSQITYNDFSEAKQATFRREKSLKKATPLLPLFILFMLFFLFCAMSAEAVRIIDDSGNSIVCKKPFKRIISLYGAHTENLFSLGLNEEIIGVSKHEAYPPEALTKPVYSYHDDPEKFIAARPDLVLIRPMIYLGYKKLIDKLQGAGIFVVSLQPTNIEDIFEYWRELGILAGREKEAQAMIGAFQATLHHINRTVQEIPLRKRKRVYFESIHHKMKTFAPRSIALFALKSAGGINIAEDAKTVARSNIADYGKERILAHARDIDFYLAQNGVMNNVTKEMIMKEPGFEAIKAVREGQVYIIDEMIVSRPTRRLEQGIYRIVEILYPHLYEMVSHKGINAANK